MKKNVIEKNKKVTLHYDLEGYFPGEFATTIEVADADEPFVFTVGKKEILPALENALIGKSVGDEFDVTIAPEDAYGVFDKAYLSTVLKSFFYNESGYFDTKQYYIGAQITVQDVFGKKSLATIEGMDDAELTLNFNHRLAGKYLQFKGKIVDIK